MQASAYCSSTHFPPEIFTITRARRSSPRWSVALMLTTPLVVCRPLIFSSASRNALRNAGVPGFALLSAGGIACCSSSQVSQA